MKVVLQRVSEAAVAVEGQVVGSIGKGFLLLCGIGQDDTPERLKAMAEKIARMRIFPDSNGKFHYSLLDVEGELLLIPQFTLFADTSKGRRPDFFGAMKPPEASELFLEFSIYCENTGVKRVEKGIFGADMKVSLVNDGPVTILLEN